MRKLWRYIVRDDETGRFLQDADFRERPRLGCWLRLSGGPPIAGKIVAREDGERGGEIGTIRVRT